MSDKTLMERLRDLQNDDCAYITQCDFVNAVGAKCCREMQGYGCNLCFNVTIKAIIDAIEHEYLPRPRFEDGESVQFGDEFVYDKSTGQSSKVFKFGFTTIDGCTIYDSMGNCSLHPKRPEPEVLDADGVPIHKDDTVYFVDCPESFDVLGIERDGDEPVHIGRNDGTATDAWVSPLDITHKQPDSLERIEEDAKLDVCDYYAGRDEHKCDGCRGAYCFNCKHEMTLDLLRRQREVLERDHER